MNESLSVKCCVSVSLGVLHFCKFIVCLIYLCGVYCICLNEIYTNEYLRHFCFVFWRIIDRGPPRIYLSKGNKFIFFPLSPFQFLPLRNPEKNQRSRWNKWLIYTQILNSTKIVSSNQKIYKVFSQEQFQVDNPLPESKMFTI